MSGQVRVQRSRAAAAERKVAWFPSGWAPAWTDASLGLGDGASTSEQPGPALGAPARAFAPPSLGHDFGRIAVFPEVHAEGVEEPGAAGLAWRPPWGAPAVQGPPPGPGARGVRIFQAKAEPDVEQQAGPPAADLAERIEVSRGGGAPLEAAARTRLEDTFGHDLAAVRLHADGEADALARAVDATAFTTGRDIFFRAGAYAPGSPDGLQLLAHEAAHVLQQAAGPVAGTPAPGGVAISDPSDNFEERAERSASQVVGKARPAPQAELGPPLLAAAWRAPAAEEEPVVPVQRQEGRTATAPSPAEQSATGDNDYLLWSTGDRSTIAMPPQAPGTAQQPSLPEQEPDPDDTYWESAEVPDPEDIKDLHTGHGKAVRAKELPIPGTTEHYIGWVQWKLKTLIVGASIKRRMYTIGTGTTKALYEFKTAHGWMEKGDSPGWATIGEQAAEALTGKPLLKERVKELEKGQEDLEKGQDDLAKRVKELEERPAKDVEVKQFLNRTEVFVQFTFSRERNGVARLARDLKVKDKPRLTFTDWLVKQLQLLPFNSMYGLANSWLRRLLLLKKEEQKDYKPFDTTTDKIADDVWQNSKEKIAGSVFQGDVNDTEDAMDNWFDSQLNAVESNSYEAQMEFANRRPEIEVMPAGSKEAQDARIEAALEWTKKWEEASLLAEQKAYDEHLEAWNQYVAQHTLGAHMVKTGGVLETPHGKVEEEKPVTNIGNIRGKEPGSVPGVLELTVRGFKPGQDEIGVIGATVGGATRRTRKRLQEEYAAIGQLRLKMPMRAQGDAGTLDLDKGRIEIVRNEGGEMIMENLYTFTSQGTTWLTAHGGGDLQAGVSRVWAEIDARQLKLDE